VGDFRANPLQTASRSRIRLTQLLAPTFGKSSAEIAAHLIDDFGTLADLLAASDDRIRYACSAIPKAVALIGLVKTILRETLAFQLLREPIIAGSQALRDYLVHRLAFADHEIVIGLFLDTRKALIRDMVLSEGTLRQAHIYPREIAKRALEVGAASLILVHNHPSGDSRASRDDITITREIAAACRAIEVNLFDHIIVARSGWSSFRAEGLL
jgi:DNA repair protein RadC